MPKFVGPFSWLHNPIDMQRVQRSLEVDMSPKKVHDFDDTVIHLDKLHTWNIDLHQAIQHLFRST